MGICKVFSQFFKKTEKSIVKLNKYSLFHYSLLLMAGLGFWLIQIQVVELFLANKGSSPMHWLYVATDPLKNTLDWPTGTRNLGKSLSVNIYALFHKFTEIDLLAVMNIYIAIEVFAMLFAFFYFYKVSDSNISIAIMFSFIVALTAYQSMNLARFGFPFSWGLYYSFAAAFRILGLAFVIKGKPWAAVGSFSISLMIHPIMGGVAVFAGIAIILYRGFSSLKAYIIPACVLSVPTLLWLYFSYAGESVTGGGIPVDKWLFLTKLFNYHWYPFSIGTFDVFAPRYWLPTISVLLLYVFVSFTSSGSKRILPEIHVAVISLSFITCIGLAISYWEASPFLIKLSLHRASDLLVVVALLPVINRLWDDIFQERFLFCILAFTLLIYPFLDHRDPGFPLAIVLVYGLKFIVDVLKNVRSVNCFVVVLAWAIGCLCLIYHSFFIFESFPSLVLLDKISSHNNGTSYWWGFLVLSVVILFVFSLQKKFKGIFSFFVLLLMMLSIPKLNADRTEVYYTPRFVAYYQAQMWAKNNTAGDSLFMLSPASTGSWRDISQRSSYGTIKEWLHNAWLYDSDYALYKEGVRRSKMFGVDIDHLLKHDIDNSKIRRKLNSRIKAKAHKFYYSSGVGFYKALSVNEGIDYFVFENRYLSSKPNGLVNVYRNKVYSIYKPDM